MFQALIIGVTETSLSYRVIDGYIEIPGYTILRQARDLAYAKGSEADGVIVYIEHGMGIEQVASTWRGMQE